MSAMPFVLSITWGKGSPFFFKFQRNNKGETPDKESSQLKVTKTYISGITWVICLRKEFLCLLVQAAKKKVQY